MSFGKAIASKCRHHFPDPFRRFRWHPVSFLCLIHKFSFQILHAFAGIEMAHRTPQQVRFCQIKSRNLIGNPQYLFLIQDHAKGFIQQWGKSRMNVFYFFLAFETAHKGILQSATERARTIQSQGRHDVIFTARMDLAQCGTHAWTFDLEATNRFALLDPLSGCWIIRRCGVQNSQCDR